MRQEQLIKEMNEILLSAALPEGILEPVLENILAKLTKVSVRFAREQVDQAMKIKFEMEILPNLPGFIPPPKPEEFPYYTLKEICDGMRLSRDTVMRRFKELGIKAREKGVDRKVLFYKEDVKTNFPEYFK